MIRITKQQQVASLVVAISLLAWSAARADAVCEWNTKAGDIVVSAKMGPPPANRAMAITNTAVYEAVNAITKRYPAGALKLEAAPGASVDAAIAAASRTALAKLLPSQQTAIENAYQAALSKIADGPAKTSGVAVGEQAAAAVFAIRVDDGASAGETYRPQTAPGVYVATVIPAVPHWPQRKPWLMTSPSQFRPVPPPALTTALWARDYNEVKTLGGKSNSRRTAEQTQIAVFWEATLPPIYNGIALSIADIPGRDVTQNARFLAATWQAADDALLAVFDAKYHYNFWRPVTAIRNGDLDGNDVTERDASWTPFIETPMHPEYPCAHCICCRRRRYCAPGGDRHRPDAGTDDDQLSRQRFGTELENRRRLRAGSRERACLRRSALSQLDRGRHGPGQASGRARCGEVSAAV